MPHSSEFRHLPHSKAPIPSEVWQLSSSILVNLIQELKKYQKYIGPLESMANKISSFKSTPTENPLCLQWITVDPIE
jgi:hypothetical protein